MAEPARKVYDEDNEDQSLTARSRADQRWGMHKPEGEDESAGDGSEDTGSDSSSSEANEDSEEGAAAASARSRADQRWGMDSSGMGAEQLKSAEEAGGSQSETKADKKEKAESGADDNESSEDDADDKKRRGIRRVITRKRAATFGIGAFGIFGGFGIFNFLQGPLQLIHFGKLIDSFHFQSNNEFSNDRSNRLLRYLRYPNQPERRRLGFVLNRYADKIEARWKQNGFEPEYNGDGNRLSSFKISPEVDVTGFQRDGINVSEPDADGFRRINIDDIPSGRSLKRTYKAISKAAGYNRVVSAINTRVLAKRGLVSFKLFTNRTRRADEKINEFYERVRKEIADYVKSGASALRINASGRETDPDGDGESDPDPNSDSEADAGNDSADGIREDVDNGGVGAGRRRVQDDLDRGSGIVSIICMAKAIAQRYPAIQYANIVLPLLRYGTGIMSMGAQIMAGKGLDFSEVGAITSRLFSEEEFRDALVAGGSWTTARSIQAQLGHRQTGPDMIPSARPSRIGNNRALNAVNQITNAIPGFNTVCDVSNSTLGGIVIDFASGGIGGVVGELLTDQILGAFGFDPIEFLARLVAGEEVDGDPAGSTAGNFGNYGGRIASDDAMVAIGGQELSENQEQDLDNEVAMLEQEEFQKLALSERLFSMENPKSLVSRVALGNFVPNTPTKLVSNLASLPLSIIPKVGSSLASIGSEPTYALAANNGYDYGFPMYGYTPEERDDAQNDPLNIANEFDSIITTRTQAEEDCAADGGTAGEGDCDWVPSNVEEFNEKYVKCFGARITENYGPDRVEAFEQIKTVNIFSNDEEDEENGRPEYCDDSTTDNPGHYDDEGLGHSSRAEAARDLQVFRFYLADTVTGHSMLCYEGEESSCNLFSPTGGGAGTTTGVADGNLGISPDGFVFPQRTTKATIIGNSPRWCYQNQNNCHHDYNAADIFAPTGTPVVAARGGTVVRAADHDNSSVGSRVTIKGDDGNLYYYAHMGDGTIRVAQGDVITAGTELGRVGTRADAVGTDPHTHFDILPPSFNSRPSCSGAACQSHPFINPQPVLIGAFNSLPE